VKHPVYSSDITVQIHLPNTTSDSSCGPTKQT